MPGVLTFQEKDSKFHAMKFTGISNHFLCNYRLTLHCVELKSFRTRSIGWALFGVNFRSLQEIEATMGGGQIFDTGAFFARLR